jgi:hypothetical protein
LLHASGGLLRSRAVFSNVSRAAFAVLSSKFLFSLIGSSPDVSVDPNGRPVQVADGLCQGNDALDLCELGASRLVRGGTGGFSRPFTERTMRMNVPKRGADTRASTPEGETKTMATTTVDNRRETVSLIGSDKVEGTPVYGMDQRQGRLRRRIVWRLPRYRRRLLPYALGEPQVRCRARRLSGRHYRGSAQ